MSHTEEFNRIMNRTNTAHKEKTEQKKIVPVLIGGGDNMNELQASIAKCRIGANVVYLPNIKEGMLSNYADVRKAFLNAGATYKNNTFIFPNDAKPYIDRLMGGESVSIKKEFQYFGTPERLADRLVELADIQQSDRVLEPSAGQGAIVNAIYRNNPNRNKQIDCCELMDVNRGILEKIEGVNIIADDFLSLQNMVWTIYYDKIIANPPFNKNQDIDHIRKMYQVCKHGGRIVTIAGNSWRFGSQKKQVEFREWLDSIGAVVEDVEAGTFKESGTNIATCIIVIDK
jgi:phospholipid N-methyltransferase